MRDLPDESATLAAGAALGHAIEALGAGDLPADGLHVHLQGPLGAGKTTLARGLLRALGERGAVKSPTYTLMEPYEAGRLRVYHFNLYRIAEPEELELLGARDLFRKGAVCVFEWAERGAGWLPEPHLRVVLAASGDGRSLAAQARPGVGERLAAALAAGPGS